jgi:hypothetical protein
MDIFTKTYTPPQELKTHDFCLFPTNQDFYQSDYEAVIKSRALLRDWSQSMWPEDDFTPEQNKEDTKEKLRPFLRMGLNLREACLEAEVGYHTILEKKKTWE